MSGQFIRRGYVTEVDRDGTADGNFNGIAPAVKVIVLDAKPWESGWIPVLAEKNDQHGRISFPTDKGAQAILACPGGAPDNMFCVGFVSGVAQDKRDASGTKAEISFGKNDALLSIDFDRTDGQQSLSFSTPGGHNIKLTDKSGERGISLKTFGGHSISMRDDDPEIEILHSSGTKLVLGANGDWTASIMGDKVENIAGDRDVKVAGDSKEEIGGDDERTVAGEIKYTANKVSIEGAFGVVIQSAASISLQNSGALTAPVVTGFPNGCFTMCPLMALPIPGSQLVKADPA